MKKFFKVIKILFLLTIIVVLTMVIGFYGYSFYDKFQKDKVLGKVTYTIDRCNESHPLAIGINNSSNRTVNKIRFKIDIFKEGYSSNLSNMIYYDYYKSDKIIKTGEKFLSCWALPLNYPEEYDIENLIYTINDMKITFE